MDEKSRFAHDQPNIRMTDGKTSQKLGFSLTDMKVTGFYCNTFAADVCV